MTSLPTVTVEETDGCSSNVGRARLPEDFRGIRGPDPERVRACAQAESRRMALKTCSCVNLRVPFLGRLLELWRKQVTGALATVRRRVRR